MIFLCLCWQTLVSHHLLFHFQDLKQVLSLHKWQIWSSSGLTRLVSWAESHWVTCIEFFGFRVFVFFCFLKTCWFSAELLRQLATPAEGFETPWSFCSAASCVGSADGEVQWKSCDKVKREMFMGWGRSQDGPSVDCHVPGCPSPPRIFPPVVSGCVLNLTTATTWRWDETHRAVGPRAISPRARSAGYLSLWMCCHRQLRLEMSH